MELDEGWDRDQLATAGLGGQQRFRLIPRNPRGGLTTHPGPAERFASPQSTGG